MGLYSILGKENQKKIQIQNQLKYQIKLRHIESFDKFINSNSFSEK
jgi:hypothetical protein